MQPDSRVSVGAGFDCEIAPPADQWLVDVESFPYERVAECAVGTDCAKIPVFPDANSYSLENSRLLANNINKFS